MIRRLHHNAYRCRDSEETRRFYEDFLGLRLAGTLEINETKSGRKTETLHTFYELGDGSYLAFFEAPDMPFDFKGQHDFDLHIALEVDEKALHAMLAKGKAAGIETRGISDHAGLNSAAVPENPRESAEALQWTTGYLTVEPVLICNSDGYRPASWKDLDGETVAYVDGAGLDPEIDALRSAHPGIKWQPASYPSPAGLIAQVSDGAFGYALVSSLATAIARNIYLNFDVAFWSGPKREMAWAVPARFTALREDLDRFLLRARHDGTLSRLTERYLPDRPQFGRIDASALKERMEMLLPQLRPICHVMMFYGFIVRENYDENNHYIA